MREQFDELARLHAHRFDDDVALFAWREATIGDAFPLLLERLERAEAERGRVEAHGAELRGE